MLFKIKTRAVARDLMNAKYGNMVNGLYPQLSRFNLRWSTPECCWANFVILDRSLRSNSNGLSWHTGWSLSKLCNTNCPAKSFCATFSYTLVSILARSYNITESFFPTWALVPLIVCPGWHQASIRALLYLFTIFTFSGSWNEGQPVCRQMGNCKCPNFHDPFWHIAVFAPENLNAVYLSTI